MSPEAFSREKQYGETKLQAVRDLHRAGVAMLTGTDASDSFVGDLVGFGVHDEMALLVRAGLTPIEALQAATFNPAVYLGREKELGTVERGKLADLVLLDADPRADIHNTTKVSAVFLAGKYFDRAALDQMLKDAEVAAVESVK
jgi:imidazolonepropionase-like amidohydrolase